jgi:hypothetical protein
MPDTMSRCRICCIGSGQAFEVKTAYEVRDDLSGVDDADLEPLTPRGPEPALAVSP